MTPTDALLTLREAATAIEQLPLDDERIPGLAKALARAAMELDAAMVAGDIPLAWLLAAVGRPAR